MWMSFQIQFMICYIYFHGIANDWVCECVCVCERDRTFSICILFDCIQLRLYLKSSQRRGNSCSSPSFLLHFKCCGTHSSTNVPRSWDARSAYTHTRLHPLWQMHADILTINSNLTEKKHKKFKLRRAYIKMLFFPDRWITYSFPRFCLCVYLFVKKHISQLDYFGRAVASCRFNFMGNYKRNTNEMEIIIIIKKELWN